MLVIAHAGAPRQRQWLWVSISRQSERTLHYIGAAAQFVYVYRAKRWLQRPPTIVLPVAI